MRQRSLSLVDVATSLRGSLVECSTGPEPIVAQQGVAGNAVQEICLTRFERDQAPEDMEHVHQLCGVLGELPFGLNPVER